MRVDRDAGGPAPTARRARGAARDAQRSERVVRDLARPHEIPERGEHDGVVGGTGRGDEVGPEARAGAQESVADRVVDLAVGRAFDRGPVRQQPHAVAEEQADATVVGTECTGADPDELAGRAQLVEHARPVAVDPGGQHVAFEHRRRDRHTLQLLERLDQRVGAAPAATRRPATRAGSGRRWWRRPARSRGAARRANGGAGCAARSCRTIRVRARRAGTRRTRPDRRPPTGSSAVRARSTEMSKRAHELLDRERHVRARVAGDDVVERAFDRIGERRRAVPAGSPTRARRAAGPRPRRPRGVRRSRSRGVRRAVGRATARASAVHRARTSSRVSGPRSTKRSCRSSAWRAWRVGINRCSSSSSSASASGSSSSRSSSAPMRSRRRSRSSASAVARRSASGASPSYMYTAIQPNSSDCANGDARRVSTGTTRSLRERISVSTSRNAGTSNTSRRHSRVVSNNIGNDGKPLATSSRSAARWRCCHSGVRSPGRRRGSSSARAAFSRNFDANNDVFGSPATSSSSISSGSGRRSSVATSSIDSGSRRMMPSSLHSTCTGRSARASRSSMTSAHGACTREPNGVRMQTRQSPISSGKRSMTIVRSSGIAPVDSACSSRYMRRFDAARASRPPSRSARLRARAVEAAQLAHEAAEGAAELERPARTIALPERGLRGLARRRGDDDAVDRDLLDPPGRRAEHEALADAALVDHLLVELADAPAVGQEHAEQAAVGDRSAALHRHRLRAFAPADASFDAVPHHPRPQARRNGRTDSAPRACRASRGTRPPTARRSSRTAARARTGRRRSTRRSRTRRRSVARARRAGCAGSASPRPVPRACAARRSRLRGDRRGTSGRSCRCSARRPGARPGRRVGCRARPSPGDSTSTTRSTVPMSMPSSRLDVATMPRSRPSFSSDSTCTRCSRASDPWCARTSSSPASSLRLAASRSARRRALQNTIVVRCARISSRMRGMHVRPDAAVRLGIVEPERARRCARGRRMRAGFVHVVDGDDHLDVERLARPRVDDRDRSLLPAVAEAAEEPRDLVERALRCRQTDALRRRVGDRLESFEREHQVRAALGGGERMDLVDDHRLHAAQRFAGPRGEHEVERLGRGDEDVGRVAHELLAFLARRVAGTHRDGRCVEGFAEPFGRERDPRDRRAQVLLDVERERAQRRYVQDATAPVLGRAWAWSRAGRSPRGTRPASCPSPWVRAAACGRRSRSPASPWPGRRWARRSSSRTRPGRAH